MVVIAAVFENSLAVCSSKVVRGVFVERSAASVGC